MDIKVPHDEGGARRSGEGLSGGDSPRAIRRRGTPDTVQVDYIKCVDVGAE